MAMARVRAVTFKSSSTVPSFCSRGAPPAKLSAADWVTNLGWGWGQGNGEG